MDVEHIDKKPKIEEIEEEKQVTIDLGEALKKRQESNVEMLRIIAIIVTRLEKLESVFKNF